MQFVEKYIELVATNRIPYTKHNEEMANSATAAVGAENESMATDNSRIPTTRKAAPKALFLADTNLARERGCVDLGDIWIFESNSISEKVRQR